MNSPTGQPAERWTRSAVWRAQHRIAANDSWRKLLHRPVATGLVWLVVAISLALPSALLLTVENLRPIVPDLARSAQLSVMLDREADRASAEAVQGQIENWSQIDAVRLVSREQALSEFGEQTGLATLLASLDRNPLPHTLRVLPRLPVHDSALNRLIGELESLPNVTRVVADTRWMSRLEETLVAGERWVLALGAAMILGAILALANTLHLAIDARREEILVVRVIGGSPAFVRRPFLYTGLYFGVGGGVLAALMLWALSLWLTGPVNALFLLYDSPGQLQGPGLVYPLALILLGAIIGWLVSWAAAEHYFRQLETR